MKTSAPSASVLPVQLTAGSQNLLPTDPIDCLIAGGECARNVSENGSGPAGQNSPIPQILAEPAAVIGPGFNRALRIDAHRFLGHHAKDRVHRPEIALKIPLAANVLRGDVVLIRFFLRCVQSADGWGSCICQVLPAQYEQDKPAELRAMAGAKWKQISFPFECNLDLPAQKAAIAFAIGFDQQTIEIGGIEAVNYGRHCPVDQLARTSISYSGREADASWRRHAQERIERLRKGNFAIAVVDELGHAVRGARVSASLVNHAFGFGSCVTVDHLLGTTLDCDTYRQTFLENFNRAVFENDMKWPATEGEISPRLDAAVNWLQRNDISVRGHNLVWPAWRWLPRSIVQISGDSAALRRAAAEHIAGLVSHFRGALTDWDVVNEPYSCHEMLDAMGSDGGIEVISEWFKLAHQADPECRLCINDFGILDGGRSNPHRREYLRIIRQLLMRGAPLGGIGIQSHFGYDLPSPHEVLAVLDEFAALGLPLQSTEFSINCDDPQMQADYLRDYATALFSHPAVEELILWGFWSGRHWRPLSALYSDDWSVRPIGQAWADLQKQWSTRVDAISDADGKVNFRGFFGTYEIEITNASHTARQRATFTSGSGPLSIALGDHQQN